MNLLVSVIIPAYNSEKVVGQAIESALHQTYNNLEIIVVDDGSLDDTFLVASSYSTLGVKVFKQKNRGSAAARNYGFLMSTGELIQFLDADDLLAPDKIELQISRLEKLPNFNELMIHCRWGRFKNSVDEEINWGPHYSIQKDLVPIDWLIANHMSNTHCWLTHRDLINKAGLWNEDLKINQDGEFFSRLIVNSKNVLYCDEAKVYYRSGLVGSVSRNITREAAASSLKSIELIQSYIFSLEKSPRTMLAIANKYQAFAFSNYIAHSEMALIAESKASSLGGADLELPGGQGLKILGVMLGWKKAMEVKKALQSILEWLKISTR